MEKVNRELITLARESTGFMQAKIAESLGIEQGTLSKIENGILEPSEELITKIAEILNFPVKFFYQDWKPIRVEGHYRKKITLPVKALKECKAKMTLAESHLNSLLASIELPPSNIPKWNVEIDGAPSMCAQYVREYWKISKGRIENLTKILEDNGIVIFDMDLGDLDGFSTFSRDNIPLIFTNKNRPGDRDRFNKAHELAHFIMHFGQKISESRDIEKEANEFASELLLPQKDIIPYLKKLNLTVLADLKSYWKVSMQSIVYKAKQTNFLTDNQYEYLWKQMGALGYRKKEPIEIKKEVPTLFTEILETYFNDLGYSKSELSELLKFNEDKVDEWYFNKITALKIVRNRLA